VTYILTLTKALTLVAASYAADGSQLAPAIAVGDEALCPSQLDDSRSDEEYECRVISIVDMGPALGSVVVLGSNS
jgi:hypothetical protein